MEKTINAIKTLRETLRVRSIELEELILSLEEQTCRLSPEEQETDEAQDLIHQTSRAYQELRANDKLMQSLSLCEYCKASDHNLCNICG